jgi:small subunit ribosomal protein S1
VDDATRVLKEGDKLESRFIGVDRKNRIVSLSVKAKEIQEEEEAVAEYRNSATSGKTSLGDILKEQIGGDER